MSESDLYMELRREKRNYDARIEQYFEEQEMRRMQDEQRQRMLNGGHTDAELGCYDDEEDDIDDEDAYGII